VRRRATVTIEAAGRDAGDINKSDDDTTESARFLRHG
jgi:hypothetical protein